MVRSKEDIKTNALCLLTNIESFLLLDMGGRDISFFTKKCFRSQLHYAIFILDKRTGDGDEDDWQQYWDRGMELINSENSMETIRNSFTRHGAMYARVLFNFYRNNQGVIAHIDRFLNSYKQNSSSEISNTDGSGAYSSSSDSSSSDNTDSWVYSVETKLIVVVWKFTILIKILIDNLIH